MNNKRTKKNWANSYLKIVSGVLLTLFITPSLLYAGLYRWVDENGVVHFGDRIPAKYSKIKREEFNSQGMKINELPAEKTKEQLVAEELQRQLRLEEERLAKLKAHRDNILLNSYFTVADIERIRDEKVAQLNNQMELLDLNLENLMEGKESLIRRIDVVKKGNADDKANIVKRFEGQLAKNETDQKDIEAKNAALKAETYKITAFYAKEAADFTVLKLQKEAEEKARLQRRN